MLVVQDILISIDIIEEKFICNLSACKGACCVEGDYGAPLKKNEVKILADNLERIKPFLPQRSLELLEQSSYFEYNKNAQSDVTACHDDGACVFLTKDELGISKCGIEKAFEAGKIDYQKPISCHLYPIRVSSNDISGFEAWNYDRWDICSDACTLGKEKKIPIYAFLQSAITRYKGEEFYEELAAGAAFMTKE